jgi:hypothetical protein
LHYKKVADLSYLVHRGQLYQAFSLSKDSLVVAQLKHQTVIIYWQSLKPLTALSGLEQLQFCSANWTSVGENEAAAEAVPVENVSARSLPTNVKRLETDRTTRVRILWNKMKTPFESMLQ